MSTPPTRTACFRPDRYDLLSQFANRSALRADLVGTLEAFLSNGAPGEARILVRGQRGVGKSMLSRVAIKEIVDKYGPLYVIVDGARTGHGPEQFLRELGAGIAKEALQNATDRAIVEGAELLRQISRATRLTIKTVRSWTKTLTANLKGGDKLSEVLGTEFGIGLSVGRAVTRDETEERSVDTALLQAMIRAFLVDAHARDQYTVILVDNLDQVGYAEIDEDVRRVTDLARFVLSLDGCVVVANLRTEFASRDLNKLQSLAVDVPGMKPEELMEVYRAHTRARGEDTERVLREAGIEDIALRLAHWTDNPWAFLGWLMHVDFERVELPVTDSSLQELMRGYAQTHFTNLTRDDLSRLGRAYQTQLTGYSNAKALEGVGIPQDLLQRSVRYSALVPDWLLSPDRYLLSPLLHFLPRI